jgi:multiple sugar transport system ATP-binding protein
MAEVRFEHVTKAYGKGASVIRDLNLRVRDHEFLVLVGPSGCGKSTLLRMIAGLEPVTEGDVYIGDACVTDVEAKDRDLAMVFQNYALYPHMTVYDNMSFALKRRHTPPDEIARRVGEAAKMLGIADYLRRKPRELSGGQRQRVALGRALVREPKVYLLDEPLSNLDAKLRVQTRTEISRLHQATQTTFVYVTHDQVEAMTMGDRIAVLDAGEIQQLGTPRELYDTPANLFVAGFIGSPSMNFFEARLVRREDGCAAVVIGEGTGAATIMFSGRAKDEVAGHETADGVTVVVGVRAEDLHVSEETRADTLAGVVEVVEHLGNEQLLYLRIPGQTALIGAEIRSTVARVAADVNVRVGDAVTLAVNASRIHVFDPSTSNRLT